MIGFVRFIVTIWSFQRLSPDEKHVLADELIRAKAVIDGKFHLGLTHVDKAAEQAKVNVK